MSIRDWLSFMGGLDVATRSQVVIRAFELVGVVVVAGVVVAARVAQKIWDIEIIEVIVIVSWFVGKLTGQPLRTITEKTLLTLPAERLEHALQSLPPQRLGNAVRSIPPERLQEIYERTGVRVDTTPKPQPHHHHRKRGP